ncbi:hypothetical protein [Streptomyces sp. CA-179760]
MHKALTWTYAPPLNQNLLVSYSRKKLGFFWTQRLAVASSGSPGF